MEMNAIKRLIFSFAILDQYGVNSFEAPNTPYRFTVPELGIPEPLDAVILNSEEIDAKQSIMNDLFHQSSFPFMQEPGVNCGHRDFDIDYKEAPWAISLIMCKGSDDTLKCIRCAATLVSYDYAVTSADCVYGYQLSSENHATRFYYGVDEWNWTTNIPAMKNTGKVVDVKIHPKYFSETAKLRVSLASVRLTQYDGVTSLDEFGEVKPACVPDNKLCKLPGNSCIGTGWSGEQNDSQNKMSSVPYGICSISDPNLICAESTDVDVCHHDAAGTLACKADDGITYIYGIGGDCKNFYAVDNDQPNTFYRITEHLEWLETFTNVILDGSTKALGDCFDDPDANLVMARSFDGGEVKQFHYDTNEFYEYVYDVDNGGSGSGGGVDGAVIDINADPDVYFDYQANKIIQTNTPRNTLGGIGQQRAAVVTSSAPLRRCTDIRRDPDFDWPMEIHEFDSHFDFLDGSCIFPEEGKRCRLYPAGDCMRRDSSAIYVQTQFIDNTWSIDYHRTKHFECAYDDISETMRWKRISTGIEDPPSNFAKFRIVCGPPPCVHPSRFDGFDLNLDGQNGVQVTGADLNKQRGGTWECFHPDGTATEDNEHVPFEGRCYLRCSNKDIPSPQKPIICKAPERGGAHQYDFVGRLYKFLNANKFHVNGRYDSMVNRAGDRMGWKCYN